MERKESQKRQAARQRAHADEKQTKAVNDSLLDAEDEQELADELEYELRRLRRAQKRGVSRRGRRRSNALFIIGAALCIVVLAVLVIVGGKKLASQFTKEAPVSSEAVKSGNVEATTGETQTEPAPSLSGVEALLAKADHLAAQYDYDAAIALLSEDKKYADDAQVKEKAAGYEETKASLVEQDISQITHVFFHILVLDPARTFTDTKQGKGYNSVMTTVDEFEKILQQMYDRGYVMVGLHDMAELQTDADGNQVMVKKPILLPEGKKAFVMSQDDVNYYEYMVGSGCADKLLLDENGKITAEYTDADGNVSTGDYDLVPILDRFVEEHPDFSYKGAKAVLALTGYNGVLGYRTDETYDASSPNYDAEKTANPNIEADKAYVKKLTQALKDEGYEFASHSWGHRDYGEITFEHLQTDAERWERNVEPLLPEPCDILLFPFGADIGDWRPYASDNERLSYLEGLGFHYFCNVDASSQYWVQLGGNYLRQGRRNLDGYRLWMDYSGADNRLSDLMNVQEVFDTRRPTPIDWQ